MKVIYMSQLYKRPKLKLLVVFNVEVILKKETSYNAQKFRFISHTEKTLSSPLEWDGQGRSSFLLDSI